MKDYLLLLDENEKLKRMINAYEFYDDEIKSTTDGERVLTFKMNDSVVDIENGNKIGVFIEGKFDLFIVDQVEAETYYSTSIKVTCLHDFYSIQTQKAITQYYRESVSLRDAMTEMLKGTSYELGECVERALIPIGPYLYKNPLWCIQDIISKFGVEIYYSIELNETRTGIARKLVHVVNALGSDTGIRCSTDLNVNKIKRVQKDKFYTVMYGCGAEYQKDLVKYKYDFKDISWSTSNENPTDKPAGQEFVEDKKAIAKYGRIIGIFEDGRIKDSELLLKKTWEALQKNNRPIISYELDIEELKTEDGYEHLNFKLGDIIILQNTIDNSRAKFRIVEDCKSIRNKNKRKVVVGEQLKGIFSGGNSGNSDGTEGPGGSVIDPGGEEIKPPSLEEITPDTLPAVPVVTAKGLWAKVMLSWTYESKMYYNYEVYASRIKDFEPTVFHMIYSGKASAFLHEAGAKETWYYRVRAVNTFGNTTEFSEQVEATTTKVVDGTEYFESAAIKDALIEELRLDRGWIGTLRGHYIDAKELSVTDGNGKRTLDIDSFGNVNLDVSKLSIKSVGVPTYNQVIPPGNAIADINVTPGNVRILANKIDLQGAVSAGGIEQGNYVYIAQENYNVYREHVNTMTMGTLTKDSKIVPVIWQGADGHSGGRNYGGMLHMGDRLLLTHYNAKRGDWSEISFFEEGDIKFYPGRTLYLGGGAGVALLNHMYPSNRETIFLGNVGNPFSDVASKTFTLAFDGGHWGSLYGREGRVTLEARNGCDIYLSTAYDAVRVNALNGNLTPTKYNRQWLGEEEADYRWAGCNLLTAPNISSDIRLKEDVSYVQKGNAHIATRLFKVNYDDEECPEVTTEDMYSFMKDIYKLARFKYKGSEKHTLGFIAQDIENSNVGKYILSKDREGLLSYDFSSRQSVIEGALQHAIEKIEELENRLKKLERGA